MNEKALFLIALAACLLAGCTFTINVIQSEQHKERTFLPGTPNQLENHDQARTPVLK